IRLKGLESAGIDMESSVLYADSVSIKSAGNASFDLFSSSIYSNHSVIRSNLTMKGKKNAGMRLENSLGVGGDFKMKGDYGSFTTTGTGNLGVAGNTDFSHGEFFGRIESQVFEADGDWTIKASRTVQLTLAPTVGGEVWGDLNVIGGSLGDTINIV